MEESRHNDGDDVTIDWQTRFNEANEKLILFHKRAASARKKINSQIEKLKLTLKEAGEKALKCEERAMTAEKELAMLKAAPHRKSDDKTLEEKCEQLQKKNSQLEQKLKVELNARKRDQAALREKTMQIKAWVMKTLKVDAEERKKLKTVKKKLEKKVESLKRELQDAQQKERRSKLNSNVSVACSTGSIRKAVEEKLMEFNDFCDNEVRFTPDNPTQSPMEVEEDHKEEEEEEKAKVKFDSNPDVKVYASPSVAVPDNRPAGKSRYLRSSARKRLQSLVDQQCGDEGGADFGRSCPALVATNKEKSQLGGAEELGERSVGVDFSHSLPASSFRKAQRRNLRPPTPPLHQHAVWETKIYNMAKSGFQFSSNALGRTIPSKHVVSICEDYKPGEYADIIHRAKPLTVPVYAKLKGRAQQIRKDPLTAPSSDSSDDETTVTPLLRHNRPFVKRQPSSNQPPVTKAMTSLEMAAAIAGCSLQQNQPANQKTSSPMTSRAIKRASSHQSMTSVESDYAIPPDAYGSLSSSSSLLALPQAPLHDEPEFKLLKTSSGETPSAAHRSVTASSAKCGEAKRGASAKCGYLKKLSGKSRQWKKRWFVLQRGRMTFYKTSSEASCSSGGHQVFNVESGHAVAISKSVSADSCVVSFQTRSENGTKTYYLAASSPNQAGEWAKSLKTAVSFGSSATSGHPGKSAGYEATVFQEKSPPLKVSVSLHQHWVVVNCQYPGLLEEKLQRVSLKLYAFNQQPAVSEESCNEGMPSCDEGNFVQFVHVGTSKSHQVLFCFNHKQDKVKFLEEMQSREAIVLSDFDKSALQLISEADSKPTANQDKSLWLRWPAMVHSAESDCSKHLSTSSSQDSKLETKKVVSGVQKFVTHELDPSNIDFHVALLHSVATTCLKFPHAQNELFAQLFRFTNRQESDQKLSRSSPYLQAWKLLALLISVFEPNILLKKLLKLHYNFHADSKSQVGQYAIYCQRASDRFLIAGPRSCAPSRSEARSILLSNPFNHSLPLSLPVHFADSSYKVIGFHGSTTISELIGSISDQCGFLSHTSFSLFVNEPGCKLQHYIHPHVKVCDVMSAWENIATHRIAEATTQPKFMFRRRLCFRAHRPLETSFEKLLIVYQIGEKIAKDRFPITRDLAIEVTALTAQIVLGPCKSKSSQGLNDVINRIFPARYRDTKGKSCSKQQREKVEEKWANLKQTSRAECVRTFLNVVRKWPLCDATFYAAKIETNGKSKGDSVWLAVEEGCLNILHHKTMQTIEKINYDQMVTFGGCRKCLMVVLTQLESGNVRKVLFNMPKIQIFSILKLIVDYMNTSVKKQEKINE